MRLFKSARCGCSSADREVYLRVALTLKDCARQLNEAQTSLSVEPVDSRVDSY